MNKRKNIFKMTYSKYDPFFKPFQFIKSGDNVGVFNVSV